MSGSYEVHPVSLKEAFENFDKLVDESIKKGYQGRVIIVAPIMFQLRPKPRWYRFWSRKRRLAWLRYERRPSLIFDGG